MQDVILYKSITNIDPGSKGQGHGSLEREKKWKKNHNKFPNSPNSTKLLPTAVVMWWHTSVQSMHLKGRSVEPRWRIAAS
jgi:hypothetical protein